MSVLLTVAYALLVRRKEFWLFMLYVCVSLVNLGYLLISVSKTVEFAIFANDVAYLGKQISAVGIARRRIFYAYLLEDACRRAFVCDLKNPLCTRAFGIILL